MRMTEIELLDYLNKAFPTKIIYADQYRLGIYLPIFADVRKYAKTAGLSSVQWLTNKGFIWRRGLDSACARRFSRKRSSSSSVRRSPGLLRRSVFSERLGLSWLFSNGTSITSQRQN